MKKNILSLVLTVLALSINAQTKITMSKEGGIYTVPCKVNGLPLKFIFDTGASDVSLSLTEAFFMLKNGYLKKEDIGESVYYSIANGEVEKGTKLNIKEIEFAGLKLFNIEASIVHELSAPLLLGQSVISQLGRIQLEGNELTILSKDQGSYDYSNNFVNDQYEINENDYSNSTLIIDPYSTTFTGTQPVYSNSPLLDKPSMGENEKQLGKAENNSVTIIEKINNKYYKVKSGNQTGYLWAGWFKKMNK
jgi:clan AA aspartic protease (TIGR02281 family)